MYVQTDYSGLQQAGSPIVGPAIKRAPVAPAREGDRAQEDRRQQQSSQQGQKDERSVFRTLLSESTLAGLTSTSAQTVKTADPIAASEKTKFIRVEKRPPDGPTAISSEETNGLFSYLATKRRNAETAHSQNQSRTSEPLPQAFIDATARYAEQAIAASNFIAGRGETLELQA